VRHYTKRRVPAHVLLCLLAEYLIWHLCRAWVPLTRAFEPINTPIPALLQ
jgi:hypothetical protein